MLSPLSTRVGGVSVRKCVNNTTLGAFCEA